MNTIEALIIIALVFVVCWALSGDEKVEPDESQSRCRMNQTHPEEIIPTEVIEPSYTSKMISINRFDKLGYDHYKELNEEYLRLLNKQNETVIF